MPSFLHELPLTLFRSCPELVPRLLGEELAVQLPSYQAVRIEESDFTQILPTEFRADLVLTLYQGDVPVLGIIVEVQRKIDPRKRYTWPLYTVALRARLQCDVLLLVVSDDDLVARWAREPIGLGPGSVLSVTALGPDGVPWVQTADEARRLPELAILSALAHGNEPDGLQVVLSALNAIVPLDAERQRLYYDLVLVSLNEATRRALEQELLMQPVKYEYKSDFARTYLAKGRVEGEARALLAVLSARGMVIDAPTREFILGCTDPEQLERWIVRAVTASSLDEVLSKP